MKTLPTKRYLIVILSLFSYLLSLTLISTKSNAQGYTLSDVDSHRELDKACTGFNLAGDRSKWFSAWCTTGKGAVVFTNWIDLEKEILLHYYGVTLQNGDFFTLDGTSGKVTINSPAILILKIKEDKVLLFT